VKTSLKTGILYYPVARQIFIAIFFLFPFSILCAAGPFTVSFIDVGYGDAIFLEFPEGEKVLVDGGYPEKGEAVRDFLVQKGVRTLDYCICTHSHDDHAGGLTEILKHFPGARLILNRAVDNREWPEQFAALLQETARPYDIMRPGDRIVLKDGSSIACLHPESLTGDPNRDSLVLLVESRGCPVLLTADVDSEVEEALPGLLERQMPAGIMVLKAAHHGWGNSSSEAFLDAVRPGIAVISTGPSEWPLPPEWILGRFRKRDIPLFRTDRLGTIEIKCHGTMMEVRAQEKVMGKYLLADTGKEK